MSGHAICLAAAQPIQARRLTSNGSQSFQPLADQLFSMDMMAFAKLFKIVALAQNVEIVAKLSVFQVREIRLQVRKPRIHPLSKFIPQYDPIGRHLGLCVV